jgi:hypothetical protein
MITNTHRTLIAQHRDCSFIISFSDGTQSVDQAVIHTYLSSRQALDAVHHSTALRHARSASAMAHFLFCTVELGRRPDHPAASTNLVSKPWTLFHWQIGYPRSPKYRFIQDRINNTSSAFIPTARFTHGFHADDHRRIIASGVLITVCHANLF